MRPEAKPPLDTPTVRIAMIGAGGMANRVHYPSLASFGDVEITAICDLDIGRLTATADTYGVEGRFADYRTMIEQTAPDAVYAIGPPHHLYDVWVWCLGQGVNLFVEKPLGLTMHHAHVLAELAARNGSITQVGFQRRSAPLAVHHRNTCLERGPITQAKVSFFKNEPKPFNGALDHMLDDGTHALDTLRWLCGGNVVDVHSALRSVRVTDVNVINALVEFDSGAVGILMANWSSGRRAFSIEMHAPGICAEVNPELEGVLYADSDTEGVRTSAVDAAGSDEFHVYGGFQAKSREFVDSIKSGTLPQSHFGDAFKTMEIAHLILAQNTLASPRASLSIAP